MAEVKVEKFAGSIADFFRRAITKLPKPYLDKKTGVEMTAKGIHSVFSGVNEAYRVQAKVNGWELDPIKAVEQLKATKVIETRPARGGVMLYLPGQMPSGKSATDTLGKILG